MTGTGPDEPPFDGDVTIVTHQVVAPVLKLTKEPPRLEQVKGPGSPRVFALLAQETVVGRASDAAVSISSSLISRKHLALKRSDMGFTFTDLESANGVLLNGVRAHAAVLHQGDTLQLGDVVFIFHEGS